MDSFEVKILVFRRLKELNLTQEHIAKAIGISPTALSFILSGIRPGYKHQGKIARILKVKVADLFGNGKPKRRRRSKQKLHTRISGGGVA